MTLQAVRCKGRWSSLFSARGVWDNARREVQMSGTTNRISFDEAADLVGSGRACVAYVIGGAPRVETAIIRYDDQRLVLGVDAGSELRPATRRRWIGLCARRDPHQSGVVSGDPADRSLRSFSFRSDLP